VQPAIHRTRFFFGLSGEPRSAIGIREVQVCSGAVFYSKTSLSETSGASSFFGERVLIAIPRCSERQSIDMASTISCEQPDDHTAMELPDWASKAIEELRASRWRRQGNGRRKKEYRVDGLKVGYIGLDGGQIGGQGTPRSSYGVLDAGGDGGRNYYGRAREDGLETGKDGGRDGVWASFVETGG